MNTTRCCFRAVRKPTFLLLATLGSVAILAIAQPAPPTLPPHPLPKIGLVPAARQPRMEMRTFYIGGKQYRSALAAKESQSSSWNSSSPLPIALRKAEEIAQGELTRLLGDDTGWQVTGFQISRFADATCWYIAVTLEPGMQIVSDALPADSFVVLMDLAGTPGRISRLESQK